MVVPYPFTRALYVYGEPILVPRDGEGEEWRARGRQATQGGHGEHGSKKVYSRTRSIPPRFAFSTNSRIHPSPSRWRAISTTM